MPALSLVARFLAAFLVLLGTSGQGLAAMLCGAPNCPRSQAVAKIAAPAKESCCAKKQAKSKQESGGKPCCCEVKSVPKAAKLDSKLVVPNGIDLELARTESALTVSELRSVEPQAPIPSFTDGSPPDHGRLPDRGRAPPVAL